MFSNRAGANKLHLLAYCGRINLLESKLKKPKWRDHIDSQDHNGHTPLSWAVFYGQAKTVQFLLKSGANISSSDKNGATLLHWAARCGHLEIMKLLLKNRIDIDVKASDGSSPLHWSAQSNKEQIAQFLLDNQATIDSIDNKGHTPLYIAAQNGNEKVADLLIRKGANVDAQTTEHRLSPMLIASYKGYKEVVELLAKGGANLNITDVYGSTPISNAIETNNAEIVDFLLDRGAGIKCKGNALLLEYKDKNDKEYGRMLQDIKISAPPSQLLSVSLVTSRKDLYKN